MTIDTCSILLAEPSALLREKIAGLLGRMDQIWCIGQVATPRDLVRATGTLQPDLVLADLKLLATAGLLEQLRHLAPRAQVIGMVDTLSPPYASRARELGLDGICARVGLVEEVQRRMQAKRVPRDADSGPARLG